jgi:hypothetical protein
MTLSTKIAAFAAAAAIVVGMVAMPPNATASEEGRRNTAYALGAATLYLGIKKKTIPALIAGAGTVYAAKRMQDSIDARHKRERAYNSSSSNSSVYSASSGSSSTRRVSSSGSRATSSSGRRASMSHAQLANNAYVQSLISSAYTKGSKAGYQSGYEKGVSDGYRKGFDAGTHMSGAAARPTGNDLAVSGTTASDLYARVVEAH